MTCNKTGIEPGNQDGDNTTLATVYLSEHNIDEIKLAIAGGSGPSTILDIISSGGRVLTSSTAAIVAALIVSYMGWIEWSSDGCGVKIKVYPTIVYGVASGIKVESQ